LSALYHFAQMPVVPEIVCFEKQSTWGGLWNYTWLTGYHIFHSCVGFSGNLPGTIKQRKVPIHSSYLRSH